MSSRFCTDVVADEPLPHIKHLYNYKTASEFEADVIYLKAHYRLPTWQQFLEERSQGPRPGRPTALLTFDDGMAKRFQYARPVLLKHQVPCVFFITKGFVDNRSMFYRHKVSLCLERVGTATPAEQSRLFQTLVGGTESGNSLRAGSHVDQRSRDRRRGVHRPRVRHA